MGVVLHDEDEGLGPKDLKLQGIALATKWIVKVMEGNEP